MSLRLVLSGNVLVECLAQRTLGCSCQVDVFYFVVSDQLIALNVMLKPTVPSTEIINVIFQLLPYSG